MNCESWTLQDAKNRFSAVVEAAIAGSAQFVTRRGQSAVVVVATEEYERLRRADHSQAASLGDHLLAMPRDDVSFDRASLKPRDTAF